MSAARHTTSSSTSAASRVSTTMHDMSMPQPCQASDLDPNPKPGPRASTLRVLSSLRTYRFLAFAPPKAGSRLSNVPADAFSVRHQSLTKVTSRRGALGL